MLSDYSDKFRVKRKTNGNHICVFDLRIISSATYRIGADEAEKEIREAKKAIHTLWLRKISLLKDNKIYYKKKKYLRVMRRSKINLCFSHLKTRGGGESNIHLLPIKKTSENFTSFTLALFAMERKVGTQARMVVTGPDYLCIDYCEWKRSHTT